MSHAAKATGKYHLMRGASEHGRRFKVARKVHVFAPGSLGFGKSGLLGARQSGQITVIDALKPRRFAVKLLRGALAQINLCFCTIAARRTGDLTDRDQSEKNRQDFFVMNVHLRFALDLSFHDDDLFLVDGIDAFGRVRNGLL